MIFKILRRYLDHVPVNSCEWYKWLGRLAPTLISPQDSVHQLGYVCILEVSLLSLLWYFYSSILTLEALLPGHMCVSNSSSASRRVAECSLWVYATHNRTFTVPNVWRLLRYAISHNIFPWDYFHWIWQSSLQLFCFLLKPFYKLFTFIFFNTCLFLERAHLHIMFVPS